MSAVGAKSSRQVCSPVFEAARLPDDITDAVHCRGSRARCSRGACDGGVTGACLVSRTAAGRKRIPLRIHLLKSKPC